MLTKDQKSEIVADLKQRFANAAATVVIQNNGLTAEQVALLRRKLREAGVEYRVSKNRLVRIAVEGTPLEGLASILNGPNGIAYSFNDPTAPARVVEEILKELKEKITVRGGTLYQTVLDASGVERMAKMPGRQELLATILGGIKSPASNLAFSLVGIHQKLWGLLTAYVEKQEGSGAAEPAQ